MCFLLHLELLDQGWLETCVHVKAHPGLDQVDPWLCRLTNLVRYFRP